MTALAESWDSHLEQRETWKGIDNFTLMPTSRDHFSPTRPYHLILMKHCCYLSTKHSNAKRSWSTFHSPHHRLTPLFYKDQEEVRHDVCMPVTQPHGKQGVRGIQHSYSSYSYTSYSWLPKNTEKKKYEKKKTKEEYRYLTLPSKRKHK